MREKTARRRFLQRAAAAATVVLTAKTTDDSSLPPATKTAAGRQGTQQATTQPTTAKPETQAATQEAASKPATKPATTKPATQPATTKPAASTTKPASRPAETRPPRRTKDAGRLLIEKYRKTRNTRYLDEAIKEYTKSIEGDGPIKKEDAVYGRGIAHYLRRDNKKALADFTHTIENTSEYDTKHYNALMFRGMTHTSIPQQEPKAIEDFKQALRVRAKPIPEEELRKLGKAGWSLAEHLNPESHRYLRANRWAKRIYLKALTEE